MPSGSPAFHSEVNGLWREDCARTCSPGIGIVSDRVANPGTHGCGSASVGAVSVTVSTPPVSASVKPPPIWSGIRPRRSGTRRCSRRRRHRWCRSAETGLRSRRSAATTLAEHPAGRREVAAEHANFAHIRLCHECVSSVLRRENALQGDAEIDGQERLHVEVRLAAGMRHRSACSAQVVAGGLIDSSRLGRYRGSAGAIAGAGELPRRRMRCH